MSILELAIEYIKDHVSNSEHHVVDNIELVDKAFADEVVEYVISLTKSSNSALSHLSKLRKVLKTGNKSRYIAMAEYLCQSPVYTSLMQEAKAAAADNLVDKCDDKDIVTTIGSSKLGDYKDIYMAMSVAVAELRDGIRPVNVEDLLWCIVNFSARFADILSMTMELDDTSGNYYLKYWAKQRDGSAADSKAPYIGYLLPEDACYLLSRVQARYVIKDDTFGYTRKIVDQVRNACKELYNVNPRDLRRISSIILSSTEPNRIKRIQKQQAILRHKSPLTSVLYYS